MQGIASILQEKLSKVEQKKSRLVAPYQLEALETAEMLGVNQKTDRMAMGMLFRFAKCNPPIFAKARSFMYGLKKDGYTSKCNFGYFMFMYKKYNNEKKGKQ